MSLPAAAACITAVFSLFLGAMSLLLSRAHGWSRERWIAAISLSSAAFIALDVPVTLSLSNELTGILSCVQTLAAGALAATWIVHSQLILRGSVGTLSKWLSLGILAASAIASIPGVGSTGRILSFYVRIVDSTYRITEPSLFAQALFVVYCLTFLVLAVRFGLAWRRGVPGAAPYCIGLAALVAAAVNDSLVWAGLSRMPLVVDVCYVAPVAVAVLSLTRRVIRESAALADLSIRLEKKVEERTGALQQAEAYYRTTLASIGDGLIATGTDGSIGLMNPVAARLTGWSTEDACGRPIKDVFRIIHAGTRAEVENPVLRVLRYGTIVGLTNHTVLIARDGTERQIADSCAPILGPKGEVLGAALVFRDVTEEYQRREVLRQSEERYRVLFESSRDAIMILEPPDWRITSCNRAALEMFGVATEAELTALGPEDLSPILQTDGQPSAERLRQAIEKVLRKGSTIYSWVHKRIVGGEFRANVLLTGAELRGKTVIQATVRDITEQVRLETELGHARKLEAVGQLAAGIAHEINTPAQFVGDSIRFLSDGFQQTLAVLGKYREAVRVLDTTPEHEALARRLKEEEKAADLAYLEENAPAALAGALDGVSRIATIVGAMKEFAHTDQRQKSPADLNRALTTTLTIAKNEYKYVAEVETELGEIPPVLCHVGDLNQVFLNLLVNAAHAIADVVGKSGEKGRIRVRTMRESDAVRIEVSDTGSGIPERIRERIFEPFFTTKEVGRGSGQGLAIARSIVVDKHGGALTFESEVGRGTTFIVRLPANGLSSSSPCG